MKKEQVNHPAHYNIPGRKECIEEMIDKWGSEAVALWCELTAYKYDYRAGLKDDNSKEQDMAKRDWYLHKANEIRAMPQMTVPVAASNPVPRQMGTQEYDAEKTAAVVGDKCVMCGGYVPEGRMVCPRCEMEG